MTDLDRLLTIVNHDEPITCEEGVEMAVAFFDTLITELRDFRFFIDEHSRIDNDHCPKAYHCPELVRALQIVDPWDEAAQAAKKALEGR